MNLTNTDSLNCKTDYSHFYHEIGEHVRGYCDNQMIEQVFWQVFYQEINK
jgi:hypothetical protein